MNYEETCVVCGGQIKYTATGGTCVTCGNPDTIHSTQTNPANGIRCFAPCPAEKVKSGLCQCYNRLPPIQPDPNAAYNGKVREIAEVLAQDQLFGSDLVWDEMEEMHRQLYISSKLRAASAMVAEMAKGVAETIAIERNYLDIANAINDPEVRDILIERGLIPAKPENNDRTENDIPGKAGERKI